MAIFPAITADNQFTIQNDQPFWSKDGQWRKHKGVYQCQEFYNATTLGSKLDLDDYPEIPNPISYLEARFAFMTNETASERAFMNIRARSAAFSIYDPAHAYDFQGALYRGDSMWGQNNWKTNYAFELNGFPMNWGDGGWPCQAHTPVVAHIKVHAINSSHCVLTWTCVHINSGSTAVVKGHGTLKLSIPDFKEISFWLNQGHGGGSITLRFS